MIDVSRACIISVVIANHCPMLLCCVLPFKVPSRQILFDYTPVWVDTDSQWDGNLVIGCQLPAQLDRFSQAFQFERFGGLS